MILNNDKVIHVPINKQGECYYYLKMNDEYEPLNRKVDNIQNSKLRIFVHLNS